MSIRRFCWFYLYFSIFNEFINQSMREFTCSKRMFQVFLIQWFRFLPILLLQLRIFCPYTMSAFLKSTELNLRSVSNNKKYCFHLIHFSQCQSNIFELEKHKIFREMFWADRENIQIMLWFYVVLNFKLKCITFWFDQFHITFYYLLIFSSNIQYYYYNHIYIKTEIIWL